MDLFTKLFSICLHKVWMNVKTELRAVIVNWPNLVPRVSLLPSPEDPETLGTGRLSE